MAVAVDCTSACGSVEPVVAFRQVGSATFGVGMGG